MSIKERAVRIGKPTPLIGVASEPATFDADRPAVILLNSGVMHHVGACRLSVKIARAVAEKGLLAVRFDYSGIGDSEPRRGSDSFEQVSLRECGEVMDYIERTRGVRSFILYGLCSGADAAYNTACADSRVVATAQIDAYCYVNWRYHFEHYRRAIFRAERWRSFLSRQLGRLRGTQPTGEPHAETGIEAEFYEIPSYVRVIPPKQQVVDGLTQLVRRSVEMYVIFTGGEPHYNHAGQYRASLSEVPFGDRLSVDYFPGTNHIITQPQHQHVIVERVARWIARTAEKHRASEIDPGARPPLAAGA